jgi:hypothetical protein
MGNWRVLVSGALIAGSALGSSRALASEEFPAAIEQAAGMPCTPSCVICHGEDPGHLNTFTRRLLGRTMFAYGLTEHDADKLKANYGNYVALKPPPNNPNAMIDFASAPNIDAALKRGLDPETGDDVCIPTYGCGAHVASHAPPRDASSALWIVFALALGTLVRRQLAKTD